MSAAAPAGGGDEASGPADTGVSPNPGVFRDAGLLADTGVLAELRQVLEDLQEQPTVRTGDSPAGSAPPSGHPLSLTSPPMPDDPIADLHHAIGERHRQFRSRLEAAASEGDSPPSPASPQGPASPESTVQLPVSPLWPTLEPSHPVWSPPSAPASALRPMTGTDFIEAWKQTSHSVATRPRRRASQAGDGSAAALSDGGSPDGTAVASAKLTGAARLPVYRLFASVGGLLTVLGGLTILFVGFQLVGTNWVAARSQQAMRRDFARLLAGRTTVGGVVRGSPSPAVAAPVPGGAVAVLRIPRIGVDKVVVEGTTTGDLMKGPGHYGGTPLPGQAGNVAIAGHRTTYGAPFFHLDQIRPGDEIIATTPSGTWHYRVSSRPQAVSPTDTAVLDPTHDNRLTLTTCTPAFSASQRLIVVAELDPGEPPLPAPTPPAGAAPLIADGASSVALSGDVHAWPSALLWAMVALAAAWAAREWGRRWHRLPIYLLTAPFVALVLFACFENVNRLLPANL
jgi:sortase A